MKYTLEIEINLPRDKVVKLFDNPDNMKHWQPGFINYQHLSGKPGQAGSKTKLRYNMGKREIEMIEKINLRKLPELFAATYEANGVWNNMRNIFSESESGKTIWTSHAEFRFSGFMKIIAPFMQKSFKKKSFRYMKLFKEFAEKRKIG